MVRPRLKDVAELAGVSIKTVSNVVNDYPHVSDETRARVEAAIAELSYRPNLSARSLRAGRSGVDGEPCADAMGSRTALAAWSMSANISSRPAWRMCHSM